MNEYDATGIEPSSQGQSKLLPKEWFTFEVIEYTSKDGAHTYPEEGFTNENHYPKVNVLVQVVDEGEYQGERIFHTVTFMPKGVSGAGMAIHFLKTIGQPYEGKFTPDPLAWVGERFLGYAVVDEYKGKQKNKLGEIKPVEFRNPEIAKAAKTDDIPF